MNIEKYLEEILSIDSKIANKQYEYEMWVDIANGNGGMGDGERVQSSGNKDKQANAIVKYADVEREIEALKREKALFIRRIERLKKNQYNVMHDFYIKGLTLKQSALSHQKRPTWATTTHKIAKEQLKRMIEGEQDV